MRRILCQAAVLHVQRHIGEEFTKKDKYTIFETTKYI